MVGTGIHQYSSKVEGNDFAIGRLSNITTSTRQLLYMHTVVDKFICIFLPDFIDRNWIFKSPIRFLIDGNWNFEKSCRFLINWNRNYGKVPEFRFLIRFRSSPKQPVPSMGDTYHHTDKSPQYTIHVVLTVRFGYKSH